MNSFFNWPLLNPFKMVKNIGTIHFDDTVFCKRLKDYHLKVPYFQKWRRADTTLLQCESTIKPKALNVYNTSGILVKAIEWEQKFSTSAYTIYELLFDVTDVPESDIILFQEIELMNIHWELVSEPIELRNEHPGTMLFEYWNSFNDWDVAFTTGIKFKFRCEADIDMPMFARRRSTHINQQRSVETLSGTPYRTHTLFIGHLKRVAPYIVDILNRIFVCDHIYIEDKRYDSQPETDWQTVWNLPYPLVNSLIEITEWGSTTSTSFAAIDPNDGSANNPGTVRAGKDTVIVAYNIETSFFGPGALVPITEIERG